MRLYSEDTTAKQTNKQTIKTNQKSQKYLRLFYMQQFYSTELTINEINSQKQANF